MKFGIFVLLIVALLPGYNVSLPSKTVSSRIEKHTSCSRWKSLLTKSIMDISISYLADNPRNNQSTINPRSVSPYTPSGLFKAYYGKGASAVDFKTAILDIFYAVPQPFVNEDRMRLRRSLYTLAKAGSSEMARKVMSSLLTSVVSDYSSGSQSWKEQKCLPTFSVKNATKAIAVEFARLRNEIGESLYGQFLGIGLGSTLAFVIDDTGSMSGEIEAAKKRVEIIIDHLQNTLDRPQDFVLVPFNDPGVGPLTVTKDANEFKVALGRLHAHGGGDQPEKCMRGIQLAVEASRPGSTLYVITDADAKDYKLQDSVIAEAKRKNIIIVFMLTNDLSYCASRNSAPGGFKKCISLYQHVASETGGTTLVVSKGTIFKATEIVQTGIKQGLVVITKHKVKGEDELITFPVDKSVSEVIAEAQGNCGKVYLHTSRNATSILTTIGDLYSVTVPVANSYGEWMVSVQGANSECNVKISAKSTLGFILTILSKKATESDSSYKILKGQPSPSDTLTYILDPYGLNRKYNDVIEAKFVNDKTNDVFDVLEGSLIFYSKGKLGNISPFYLMVEGKTAQGESFRRVIPRQIATSHVTMTCNFTDVVFRPGIPTNVTISVHNSGPTDKFVFGVSDSKNFAKTIGPTTASIHTNGEKKFRIRLYAPSNTGDGVASPVTVTARGTKPGSFQYDVCTAVVGQKKRPRVNSLAIKGTINSRFAETVVTSSMTNNADIGREAEFVFLLPVDAFITNITMKLENETIVGQVEEKKKAKKVYEKAKEHGKAAGHVAVRESSTRVYKTSMFIEARKNITFHLTYQQLLRRIRGKYKYSLTLNPNQPLKKFHIDIFIVEEEPLQFVSVPPIRSEQVNHIGEQEPAGVDISFGRDRRSAHVKYAPSISQQTEFSSSGLSGTFEVLYDVMRSNMFGDVTQSNGYFVHFFAPPSLPEMPKIVMFIIDTSGSMFGYKINQVKEALSAALRGLNKNDYFNLVFFNNDASPWIRYIMSPASNQSINNAIEVLDEIKPRGGTNILAGFEAAFDLMKPFLQNVDDDDDEEEEPTFSGEEPQPRIVRSAIPEHYSNLRKRAAVTQGDLENYAKMMVFLTDGSASVGETDPKLIVADVDKMNKGRVKIHTVGFGALAQMNMLQKLAARNGGVSRRIFEDLDAAAQLRDFFEEVTNPLLTDVSVIYPLNRVDELTENTFGVFTAGSELVVAGKFQEDVDLLDRDNNLLLERPTRQIHAQVRGKSFENEVGLDFDIDPDSSSTNIEKSQHKINNFTERMWAFLRIKDLLRESNVVRNESLASELKEQALNLSLKHGFVTPMTSLIVLRSEDRKKIEKELKKELEMEEKRRKEEEEAEERRREEEERRREEGRTAEETELLIDRELLPVYDSPSASGFRKHRLEIGRMGSPSYSDHGSGGSIYGDPHFFIPVRKDFNLCFNWDGADREIYNLLHDNAKKVTVNGQLIATAAPEESKKNRRTFISSISVIIPDLKFKILIFPDRITMLPAGADNFTLPVTSPMTFKRSDIEIRIYNVTKRMSMIDVSYMPGLTFHIVQHRLHHPHCCQVSHLDFTASSNMKHALKPLDGVIGQFFNSVVHLEEIIDENTRSVSVNNRSGRVVKYERAPPGSHKKVTCWYSRNNARDLIRGEHERYLVNEMMEIPRYSEV